MLALKYRLKKKKDFDRVLQESKTLREDFLVIKIKENQQENPRFGFVVSKRVAPKATQRNKIKRLLRETVRNHIQRGEINNNIDVVVIVLPGIQNRGGKDIRKTIDTLLRKIKDI